MNNYLENNPSADILINSMRAMGYTFESAIADVIDNSVEQLVNGNWVVVKDTNSLSNGQYRMKYVYNDKDEYVYTTILLPR